MYTFYKLDNGKIWDIPNACFVDNIPSEAEWVYAIGEDGKTADEKALYFNLKFFNLPLGELATDEDKAKEIRIKRNTLLTETDYLMMPDYPIKNNKESILVYRQALRDITEQKGFPKDVIWPEKTWE